MKALRFHVTIGEDGIIRVPEGFLFTPGEAEVLILQPEGQPTESSPPPEQEEKEHIVKRLARMVDELGIDTSDLPSDYAENHDHYLHGLPKGIDNE